MHTQVCQLGLGTGICDGYDDHDLGYFCRRQKEIHVCTQQLSTALDNTQSKHWVPNPRKQDLKKSAFSVRHLLAN